MNLKDLTRDPGWTNPALALLALWLAAVIVCVL